MKKWVDVGVPNDVRFRQELHNYLVLLTSIFSLVIFAFYVVDGFLVAPNGSVRDAGTHPSFAIVFVSIAVGCWAFRTFLT